MLATRHKLCHSQPMHYRGRQFSENDLAVIREVIAGRNETSRNRISKAVCQRLSWIRENGKLKDMACRVALLQMERDGLIKLPAPKNRGGNASGKSTPLITDRTTPGCPVTSGAGSHGVLQFKIVDKTDTSLWNEYIERYHYIGYKKLGGAQIRYFVRSADGELLALLGFSAAAWKTKCRDQFIGWDAQQRERNLPFVVDNSRFLILPWVKSKNLASRILSAAAKRLPSDWQRLYSYSPLMLETFVEEQKFTGASYSASGWTCVGSTEGRGRYDRKHERAVPVKKVFVFPLTKKFREVLQR